MRQVHTFPPIFDNDSKILILGSFPSVKSRENKFYYGHPQNRFWQLMSIILNEELPKTVDEKAKMLLTHNIALWDVCSSCEINGSADSSIRDVVPNDIQSVLEKSNIQEIYTNGKTAELLFYKYCQQFCTISPICLPSTSPANAKWAIDKLIPEWEIITKGL